MILITRGHEALAKFKCLTIIGYTINHRIITRQNLASL